MIIPNPTQGNALFKLNGFEEGCKDCYYIVTDLSGKQIAKVSVRTNTNVTLSNLSDGIYLIHLQSEGTLLETQKIVIQH